MLLYRKRYPFLHWKRRLLSYCKWHEHQVHGKSGLWIYTKKIVDIGSKFAEHLGKPYKFEMICWFSKKMVRTSCTCIKKQKLLWAIFASSRNILNNFTELDDIMEKNELADKPHRIFKVDEKGIFHFTLITCCYIFNVIKHQYHLMRKWSWCVPPT